MKKKTTKFIVVIFKGKFIMKRQYFFSFLYSEDREFEQVFRQSRKKGSLLESAKEAGHGRKFRNCENGLILRQDVHAFMCVQ